METRGFFTRMFSDARRRGIEGIILTVHECRESSIRFVEDGRQELYQQLTLLEARVLLQALVTYSGLDHRRLDQEQEGNLLVSVYGRRQFWKVFLIPGSLATEMLLRFHPPAHVVESILGLPLRPSNLLDAVVYQTLEEKREVAQALPLPATGTGAMMSRGARRLLVG